MLRTEGKCGVYDPVPLVLVKDVLTHMSQMNTMFSNMKQDTADTVAEETRIAAEVELEENLGTEIELIKKPHRPSLVVCDECDKSLLGKNTLKMHKRNVHGGLKLGRIYPLKTGAFSIDRKVGPNRRGRFKVEEIFSDKLVGLVIQAKGNSTPISAEFDPTAILLGFPCNQCARNFRNASGITKHIKEKHQGALKHE